MITLDKDFKKALNESRVERFETWRYGIDITLKNGVVIRIDASYDGDLSINAEIVHPDDDGDEG